MFFAPLSKKNYVPLIEREQPFERDWLDQLKMTDEYSNSLVTPEPFSRLSTTGEHLVDGRLVFRAAANHSDNVNLGVTGNLQIAKPLSRALAYADLDRECFPSVTP